MEYEQYIKASRTLGNKIKKFNGELDSLVKEQGSIRGSDIINALEKNFTKDDLILLRNRDILAKINKENETMNLKQDIAFQ